MFLLSGIVFGLTAGLSPGPLLTLVISETLKYGKKEGIKIAIAPLITDLPIVLLTVFILANLSSFESVLGIISILGAVFLGYLAYESVTLKGINLNLQKVKAQSLKKGTIANFLSPHPYVFWFAVGAPMILKALETNVTSVLSFILGFYVCLIGSKIIISLIVEKSKSLLKSNTYVYTIRTLGILLLIFAIMFLMDGLKFFGLS